MRRLALLISPYALISPCALLLAACPSDADGTGEGSTGTDPTTATTTSTTAPDPDTTGTTPMTMTTDVDTTAADSSTTQGDTDTGPTPECPYPAVDGMPDIGLELVANGFVKPVIAVGDPQQPDRLFVADQTGFVKILEPGMTTAPADSLLEVASVGAGDPFISDERGLLGFALHPDFPDDPRVYIAWNPAGGPLVTRVTEFTLADGDPNHVDPGSERTVIEAAQPAGNHNGGMIAFGPDGLLYFGLGDGGGSDDTYNNGRNRATLLAKILRIDPNPSGDNPYTVPADNPFVGDEAFAPETYAWGFRNPWRFSFDVQDGTLYVGDVGQDLYEEIDVVVAGGDYGWSDMEGFHCFQGAQCEVVDTPNAVNTDGITMPMFEYPHGATCSIVGGGVYRSCEVPAWQGLYLYGDTCSREIFALAWDGADVQDFGALLQTDGLILGNGWNAWGDVYMTVADGVYGGPSSDGLIYRVAPI